MSTQNQIIGTIIASVLNYDQLNESLHEKRGCRSDSTYAPCDGRSVEGSQLAPILKANTGKASVPDLRGKFLRGLNIIHAEGQEPFDITTSDPEGQNRKPGDYQADEVKKHSHTATSNSDGIPQKASSGMGMQSNEGQQFIFISPSTTVNENGGTESRPRNIAVYFYIKIN